MNRYDLLEKVKKLIILCAPLPCNAQTLFWRQTLGDLHRVGGIDGHVLCICTCVCIYMCVRKYSVFALVYLCECARVCA